MVKRDIGDVSFDQDNSTLQDKATELKKIVRTFELRLKGHKWADSGKTFGYTGDVLAGDVVIQKATALLQPFCEEVNLITSKQDKAFSKQKYRVRCVMNDTLIANGTTPASNYSAIMQIFDDTLQNIGDVILGAKDLIEPSFGKEDVPEGKKTEW